MTAEDLGLTPKQHQMYMLGREARRLGYSTNACNIARVCEQRGAWMAGFGDMDTEIKATKESWDD